MYRRAMFRLALCTLSGRLSSDRTHAWSGREAVTREGVRGLGERAGMSLDGKGSARRGGAESAPLDTADAIPCLRCARVLVGPTSPSYPSKRLERVGEKRNHEELSQPSARRKPTLSKTGHGTPWEDIDPSLKEQTHGQNHRDDGPKRTTRRAGAT